MDRINFLFTKLSFYYDLQTCPTDKMDNSVRPVGIGRTLRRIIHKAVVILLKLDILKASGCLQTCAGLKGGIKAAVHLMCQIFEWKDCEAVIPA